MHGRVWGAETATERRDRRRSALIRAAIAVYGAAGYRQATVRAVCEQAGLTERYFYESFANSEDLLQACFQHVTRGLLARVRAATEAAGPTGLDRVRAGLRVYFTELREHPAAARVFLIEVASVSPATEALVSASLGQFGALLVEVLQPGPDAVLSPLLLRGVVGGGLHIAQAWISSSYAVSTVEAAEAALRLYALVGRSDQSDPVASFEADRRLSIDEARCVSNRSGSLGDPAEASASRAGPRPAACPSRAHRQG